MGVSVLYNYVFMHFSVFVVVLRVVLHVFIMSAC
jgi:hypothetical protein